MTPSFRLESQARKSSLDQFAPEALQITGRDIAAESFSWSSAQRSSGQAAAGENHGMRYPRRANEAGLRDTNVRNVSGEWLSLLKVARLFVCPPVVNKLN